MRNREHDSGRLTDSQVVVYLACRSIAHRLVICVCLLVATLMPSSHLMAQTSEYQVKAAFLYKFAGYVQWPEHRFTDEASPIVFGVMGAEQLADTLEQIVTGHTVNDRPIEVRRLSPGSSVVDVHVLFVSQSSLSRVDSVLSELASSSILTVTESPLRPEGSVINFEIINDKIRFDVSLDTAEQGGLDISARLLQVAYRVIGGQI